jgi:hypothetical protein
MYTLQISSTLDTVIERQRSYGVYEPEQFNRTQLMTAYWYGRLIERLCVFEDASFVDKPSESTDVIIFLQNLTAYLYPEETLDIAFEMPYVRPHYELSDVILALIRPLGGVESWGVTLR